MDIEVFEQLETIAKSDSNEERVMLRQFQKKDSYKELGFINQKIIEQDSEIAANYGEHIEELLKSSIKLEMQVMQNNFSYILFNPIYK